MIRGRSEKRTDPACLDAEAKFAAEELVHDGLTADTIEPRGLYLRDLIYRIAAEECVEVVTFNAGRCHKTVFERCEGCPYATVNS